jgi:Ca-activated chloride channel family protein
VGDKEQKFDFPAAFVEKSGDESFAFIEKLWATRRVGEILDQLDLKGKNDELVKELVELATRHGIVTPYTSFMADESVSIHAVAENAARAGGRLRSLEDTDGRSGVAQRAMKGSYQNANNAPASPSDASSLARQAEAADAMMAGKPSGRGGISGEPFGSAKEMKKEIADTQQNIRNVGNRTFYQRKGQWVDSQVSKEQEANAKRVKQFSDEYFDLARQNGRTLSQYLVFDEPVLLNLENQAYLIEP